jgi:hypothetical protein
MLDSESKELTPLEALDDLKHISKLNPCMINTSCRCDYYEITSGCNLIKERRCGKWLETNTCDECYFNNANIDKLALQIKKLDIQKMKNLNNILKKEGQYV